MVFFGGGGPKASFSHAYYETALKNDVPSGLGTVFLTLVWE